MDASRFDRLVASLVRPGSRRGLLGFLAALSLAAPVGALLGEESAATKGRQGTQRRHGALRQPISAVKKKRKKKCAHAGQPTSKKHKRCCTGLVKTGNICTQPGPPPSPPPCASPGPCQTGPGSRDPATGQCVYPHKPNGAPCGTASQPGGGTTRCCNGVCPEPTCIPFAQQVPGVTTCEACQADITSKCCGKDGGCESSPEFRCLCGASSGICGSDADCPFPAEGLTACICGTCQARPS
jgi:hypothetical protein